MELLVRRAGLTNFIAGKLTEATIRSTLARPCTVRYGDKTFSPMTKPGGTYRLDADLQVVPP